jgi:hypothetical protein
MGPVLERLDEAAAEADGHYGACQPLRLELLQVVQQGLQLLGVQHRQLVGPFRAYDRNPPVTYQNFECFTMCEFSQKFKTFCLNSRATKFDPNLLASHLKFNIK